MPSFLHLLPTSVVDGPQVQLVRGLALPLRLCKQDETITFSFVFVVSPSARIVTDPWKVSRRTY